MFSLVLLGETLSHAVSKLDSEVIEQDDVSLRDLFKADGDVFPGDLAEK